MTTYATMRTRIADELANDGDITAAQINNAIQSAIKHYERERWWFNTKSVTFTTTAAGQYYTSSPASEFENIISMDSMLLGTSSTALYPLLGVETSVIDGMQDGSRTGQPELYARYANKIRFYPIPDATYTVIARYVYKLADLSADGDTNAWVDECEEMTRQAAKRILCTDILHADDMAGRYATLEKAAWEVLRRENRYRHTPALSRVNWPFPGQSFNINRGW